MWEISWLKPASSRLKPLSGHWRGRRAAANALVLFTGTATALRPVSAVGSGVVVVQVQQDAPSSGAPNAAAQVDGIATEGHHIFIARDAQSEEAVGHIWLYVDKNAAIPSGFIFVLFIYKQFRGRGYGTMMMKAIEAKASALGLKRLMLHVFAHNQVAIHLYEDAGYSTASLNMMKEIPPKQ